MIMEIEQALPDAWKPAYQAALIPLAWIPPLQRDILDFVGTSAISGLTPLQYLFLVFPALAFLAGLWCTMASLYTLPFRARRIHYIGTVLVLWWDLARNTWLFWVGMGRFVFVAAGTFVGACRLGAETFLELAREVIDLPFALTGSVTQNLRKPGVPWIAFMLTVLWGALEGAVFAYILAPTVGEIVSDLAGAETHRYIVYVLFAMLWPLILGSFACMHTLLDAVAKRNVPQIVQMAVVELFVMFLEVVFFYRELVDALAPWIAQQTGVQMGIVPVMLMASFGWIGVRGMVWFLFAKYGTPTLLAIIAHERLMEEQAAEPARAASQERWETVLSKLKRDQAWFHDQAQVLLEAAVLPSLQLLAATLNFPIALCLSDPLFNLPFKSLGDVEQTKTLIQRMGAAQRVLQ